MVLDDKSQADKEVKSLIETVKVRLRESTESLSELFRPPTGTWRCAVFWKSPRV